MIIDVNVYWLPKQLFDNKDLRERFINCVNRFSDSRAIFTKLDNGNSKFVIEKPIGEPSLDYFRDDYQLEHQLSDMDKGHIDKAILKLPGAQEWFDLDLCKFYNTELAKYVAKSKGRMLGLAVVPPYATEENLRELDRAINQLGLNGIQLSTHCKDGYLDNPAYREFFRHVSQLNIPVYVHHTPVPMEYDSIKDYDNLRRSYGRCEDQIIAISREVYSDLFEELPSLKLIHSMLGGGIFTYKTMLLPHDSGNGRFDTNNDIIKERLEKNIYYEMSHAQPWGKDNLEIATKILGEDNIIYGSSYPVKKIWLTEGAKTIEKLGISDQAKNKLLFENARKIYKI
ncbi:putative TIM-barrel fold metal-dependent hydrolase [Lactobacillus colini]|uniref:TIM-barrel fold metal-dependent hydrolase n=1 Tax=Lactobacillus colini TaxID=1819254 RepID=A0ABS4MFY5_9LACO|nr:amidohydrolase family protein [Lactobacillus colini]MBP2058513.1 putative TIM-barrel fold metal-dependent hydrolase [Lactobacillus colini]